MKTAVLLYDDTCPLCKAYSKAFVKANMLPAAGRISFREVDAQHFINSVDWNRARNEIPLIDEEENKVHYGVDALLRILSNRWSFFLWYAKQKHLVLASKKLYNFISYNRRVIVPGKVTHCKYDASPDFNLKYRLLYLLFTWLITSVVLTGYSALLTMFIGHPNFGSEFLICGGQILFQLLLLICTRHKKEQILEYLGNMMTVSLLGSLLLVPMLIISTLYTSISSFVPLTWFALVVSFILYEHARRVRLIRLPEWLSAGWVLYRLLVVSIIL